MPDTWRLGVGDERARVAIVGCGGAGCNVLRRVAAPPNATRIAMNDTVHPSMAEVSTRVLVASELGAVLARSDVVPLRRTFAWVREWRFGMGAGREKLRCFVAVEEVYASPWFTSLPEEISH